MHSAFQWKAKQTGSRYNWAGKPRGLSHCCDKIPGQSHLGRFVSAHRSRGEVMVSGAWGFDPVAPLGSRRCWSSTSSILFSPGPQFLRWLQSHLGGGVFKVRKRTCEVSRGRRRRWTGTEGESGWLPAVFY